MEVFHKTMEKISRCAGLKQAKEESSAPLSCFPAPSMSSATEQSDALRKACTPTFFKVTQDEAVCLNNKRFLDARRAPFQPCSPSTAQEENSAKSTWKYDRGVRTLGRLNHSVANQGPTRQKH